MTLCVELSQIASRPADDLGPASLHQSFLNDSLTQLLVVHFRNATLLPATVVWGIRTTPCLYHHPGRHVPLVHFNERGSYYAQESI